MKFPQLNRINNGEDLAGDYFQHSKAPLASPHTSIHSRDGKCFVLMFHAECEDPTDGSRGLNKVDLIYYLVSGATQIRSWIQKDRVQHMRLYGGQPQITTQIVFQANELRCSIRSSGDGIYVPSPSLRNFPFSKASKNEIVVNDLLAMWIFQQARWSWVYSIRSRKVSDSAAVSAVVKLSEKLFKLSIFPEGEKWIKAAPSSSFEISF